MTATEISGPTRAQRIRARAQQHVGKIVVATALVAGAGTGAVSQCGSSTPPTQPTYATTGVPAGVTLHPSGALTITTRGQVIDALDVNGSITVTADDVVIKRTRVTSSYYYPIWNKAKNLTISDVKIVGLPGCEQGISFGDYTALRVDVSGCNDGMKAGDNTTIRDSFIHDLSSIAGAHNDGIQVVGGGHHIVIDGNSIINPKSQTSAILLGDEDGGTISASVSHNWLGGGGYVIYAGNAPAGLNPNIIVTANRFVRVFPHGGYYGLLASSPNAHVLWTSNVWDDTDIAIPTP